MRHIRIIVLVLATIFFGLSSSSSVQAKPAKKLSALDKAVVDYEKKSVELSDAMDMLIDLQNKAKENLELQYNKSLEIREKMVLVLLKQAVMEELLTSMLEVQRVGLNDGSQARLQALDQAVKDLKAVIAELQKELGVLQKIGADLEMRISASEEMVDTLEELVEDAELRIVIIKAKANCRQCNKKKR